MPLPRPFDAADFDYEPTGIRFVRMLLAALSVVVLMSIVGCSERPEPRGTLFDRAEKHYRRGDYEAALQEYQAFLQRYPASPLTSTAKRRIRTITLEIETALSADHSFTPVYTGGDESAQQIGSTTNQRSTPPLPRQLSDDESSGGSPTTTGTDQQ